VTERENEQKQFEVKIQELRKDVANKSLEISKYEALVTDSKDQINFLQSSEQEKNKKFEQMDQGAKQAYRERDEMIEKMRTYEVEVRKLRNRVLELKGNIRVFCRMRPMLQDEADEARVSFPDESSERSQIVLTGSEQKSSLGKVTTPRYPFSFDKVFGPQFNNSDIFDEVRELVQSSLDGYNCCIFSYGQTGAGKTYLMSSHTDGMIPLAVDQIYRHTKELEKLGWSYSMSGSFVEVYNENLNDLLGRDTDLDNKKIKLQHDQKTQTTTIVGASVVPLDSPEAVHELLKKADQFRSVAATKANARSSRSHSVFILKLVGTNSKTDESCTGTLNLVDLAGSERLNHSKAEGDRLKETQNINKSLSALKDVITALGNGSSHIPYGNSTVSHFRSSTSPHANEDQLTKLLQFSLGGNSKTLMFVMVSPLQEHLEQTVASLRFAEIVNNTHIGTAKKQIGKA
jgi:kinesin family protein C1